MTTSIHDNFYYKPAQPDAKTLVLIHGAGCDHHFWTNLCREFEDTSHGLFAASLPGRGSQDTSPCKSIEEMAAWWKTTLQRHQIDHPVIIGHSMGGGIALTMAEDANFPMAGLALLATGARLRVHPNIFKMVREMGGDNGSFLPFRDSTPNSVIEAYESLQTPPISTTFADWKATNKFDMLGKMPSISCPVLIVGGEEDVMTPLKFSTYLHDNIKDSRLYIMEDGGHMFPVERAAELRMVLTDWQVAN